MNKSKTVRNFNDKNFSTFLENYIEEDSDNSLVSDNEVINYLDEDSSSSNEYIPIEHIYIPPKRIMPIDIDTYRIIYTYLHKQLPSNLCHIITDYISRRVIV
jgi:hypothetical protein